MDEKIESIRRMIGDGEVMDALESLDQLLAGQKSPFRDDSLMIKGRFKKFEHDKNMGLRADFTERNEIVRSALDLLKALEDAPKNRPEAPTAAAFDGFSPDKPAAPPQSQPPQTFPPPPAAAGYIGRFWIDGDPFEYYLHPNGQIFRLDPATRTAFHIGNRFPSTDFRFAWAYHVMANNWWSSVDHQGAIWTLNLYGMAVRIGQFQAFAAQ